MQKATSTHETSTSTGLMFYTCYVVTLPGSIELLDFSPNELHAHLALVDRLQGEGQRV